MNRRQVVLCLVAALLVGLALRTWPLWHSPLPFNPDGIVYARLVNGTVASGQFPLAEMATDELAFTALLTTVSHVTGMESLSHSQGVLAIIGTVPVLFLATVTARVSRQAGIGATGTRYAACLAAWTLAIEGLYLHRSMPVDEQTVGLLLVPLGLVSVVYTAERDRRWWWVSAVTLGVLPAVHNLDAFVMALALSLLIGIALRRDRLGSPKLYLSISACYWLWFVGYTLLADTLTAASVIQQSRISAVPDLVLAWLLLIAVTFAWYVGQRAHLKRTLLALVLTGWFVILALNAVTPIFPGLPQTNPTVLYGIAPLVVLVGLFAVGVPRTLDGDTGTTLVALVGAVTVVVGISLTAALTAEYLNTLYRVQTFAHFPVVAIASTGAALAVGRQAGAISAGTSSRSVAGALACLVLAASVASVPVAYGGLDVLSYKGVTTPAELRSSGFVVDRVDDSWTGDDHLVRITPYHGSADGRVEPTYAYLTGSPPPGCPMLVQRSWTTVGGQLYPRDPAAVSETRFVQLRVERNLVYASGVDDRVFLSVPRGRSSGC
ncbi:hypothetical protein [Haloarchaeobius iranensis]|uniref:Sodium/phosphate symporter n=1 Tax=Haloarchaeobius iranensis TaxID=996166 RepID=A0A1H0AFP9_9EURY|nr:hypothetical protein [Haloarchaeobius iranensis]SDN31626.1 hypothetical protein SAMN05192554_12643 [Haloarchaeobius iranensis]